MFSKRSVDAIMKNLYKKKAQDTIAIDLRKLSDVTDFFIICTAESDIHSKALADFIQEELKKKNIYIDHIEGYNRGHWILMDYMNFVIHIFLNEERMFYNLERLWGDAPSWGIDEGENKGED